MSVGAKHSVRTTITKSNSGAMVKHKYTSVSVCLIEKEKAPCDGETLTTEDALKYTFFLVDVNQLYDVVLGMYDFSLVLLVAEKVTERPQRVSAISQ